MTKIFLANLLIGIHVDKLFGLKNSINKFDVELMLMIKSKITMLVINIKF